MSAKGSASMIGQAFDHYRIESKLGEGGMGVVYQARDTHLDRPVAIKLLPPDKVADPARKQRFIQEARAASALNHPNIVTIYDIRSANGADFIVMEYVAGHTLEDAIASKPMRPAEALKYAVQIAAALAAAHEAGILHRDLKPSNIMITKEERAKILDFGLAKLLEPVDSSSEAATLTARQLTQDGAVLGTAAYMSPEQAEGNKLDGRSDIFSFGAVLYQMLTGRKPFTGDSQLALLTNVLHEDPTPPRQLVTSVSPELDKIVLRCLRKDPARRYQTMADLRVALEDVAADLGAEVSRARAPSRRPWIWAALLSVPLVAGFVISRAYRASPQAEPLRAVALTTFPGTQLYPSFSPDGDRVAFSWTGPNQDNANIYVQMIGSGSPLQLTATPRNDYSPIWSPDGRWIAFLRGESSQMTWAPTGASELRLVPSLGGPERRLAEIHVREPFVGAPRLAWCPDATCLVVTDSPAEGKPDALFLVSLETGERRQLTNPQRPVLGDSNPAISPDGRSLVFRRNVAFAAGELYWLSLADGLNPRGEPRRLTLSTLDAGFPAFIPDGKGILFSARGSLWRLAIQGEHVPERLPFVGENGVMPVISRPQPGRLPRLVYVRNLVDINIWHVETSAMGAPAASPPVVAISSTREDRGAALSPDGHRVAFQSNRSGNMEIWVGDPDGGNAVQLTTMAAQDTGSPIWSPDGELIAFDSNLEGQYEIYVIHTAGGKVRRLVSHPSDDHLPSFSRDGRWIYFSSNRTGTYQVWKVPSSGGDAIQVTHNDGFRAFESPDGSHIYYTQSAYGSSSIWRLATSGGPPEKVLDRAVALAFVVLKSGIYYVDRRAGTNTMRFFDFTTNQSTTVAADLGPLVPGLTASPDGRTILYSRVDSSIDELILVENFR